MNKDFGSKKLWTILTTLVVAGIGIPLVSFVAISFGDNVKEVWASPQKMASLDQRLINQNKRLTIQEDRADGAIESFKEFKAASDQRVEADKEWRNSFRQQQKTDIDRLYDAIIGKDK